MQNDKEFRNKSTKTQSTVRGLYRTLHEIESAIESTIKTNTEWAKQFWHAKPIQK